MTKSSICGRIEILLQEGGRDTVRKTIRCAAILLTMAAAIGGCGGKADVSTQNKNTIAGVESADLEMSGAEEPKGADGAKEYLYSDLMEIKDKFWNLWVEETEKLSEAEYFGTSEDEEEQYEHYLKVATDITNKIAKDNEDIPVGEKIIVTGYIEDIIARDENAFFIKHGDGKVRFYLKHNAKDSQYNGFLCTTNEEIFLDLEDNTPVKIEAIFLKPDIIGSNNDLYDCKIIE